MIRESKYNIIISNSYKYNLVSQKFLSANSSLSCFRYRKGTLLEKIRYLKDNFIVNYNEIEYINYKFNEKKFQNKNLYITIAVTLDCNFNCVYCYESKKEEYLPKILIPKILKFIKDKLINNNIKNLHVTWYGGEPLLNFDIIYKLGQYLIKLCNAIGCKYTSTIFTNGYLLTKDILKRLKEININSCKITIDGPGYIHNKRRRLKDKKISKGTFNHILNNIPLEIDTDIIVNIDKKNIAYIIELVDDILSNNMIYSKIKHIYLGRTKKVFNPQINSYHFKKNCFAKKEFLLNMIKIYYFLKKKQSKSLKKIIFKVFPGSKFFNCMAVMQNSYVISPRGEIYKCWETIGINSEKIGDLDGHLNKGNLSKWCNYDIKNYKECIKCKVLPICMTGCPYQKLLKKKDCNGFKYIFNKKNVYHKYFEFYSFVINQYKNINVPI